MPESHEATGDPPRLPVGSPLAILELCQANYPSIIEASNNYADRLPAVVRAVGSGVVPTAVAVVFMQAVNDFNDLLLDAMGGRGKSAVRASRTLFEDLLNLAALVEDVDLCDRYLAHWPIAVETFLRWDPLAKYLQGKQRKAAIHHTKVTLRDNAPDVAEALTEYGNDFRRSWHPQSVADRARALGLSDQYEWYRLSSAVVHGAAIGSFGTFWMVGGEQLHRVGPALEAVGNVLAGSATFEWRAGVRVP